MGIEPILPFTPATLPTGIKPTKPANIGINPTEIIPIGKNVHTMLMPYGTELEAGEGFEPPTFWL